MCCCCQPQLPVLTKIDLDTADPEPVLTQMEQVFGTSVVQATVLCCVPVLLLTPLGGLPWLQGWTRKTLCGLLRRQASGLTTCLRRSWSDFRPPRVRLADSSILRVSCVCALKLTSGAWCVWRWCWGGTGDQEAPFRSLLFDSWYDEYRGVICVVQVCCGVYECTHRCVGWTYGAGAVLWFGAALVSISAGNGVVFNRNTCAQQVVDGAVSKGMTIASAHSGKKFQVQEVGLLAPSRHSVDELSAGQVGYLIGGMKSVKEAEVGDTLCDATAEVRAKGWGQETEGGGGGEKKKTFGTCPTVNLPTVAAPFGRVWGLTLLSALVWFRWWCFRAGGCFARFRARQANGVRQYLPCGLWRF